MKIALIEDDPRLSTHLCERLRESGYNVTPILSFADAQDLVDSPIRLDLIILDRLLGASDTKALVPAIKRKWPQAPLLILSAISTPNERVELLNLGADDYLGKPFSTQELLARIRAILRRLGSSHENFLKVGDLIVDSLRRVIIVGEKSDTLSSREFSLLRTLATDASRVWSRDELLDYVWGQSTEVDTNVVEATIANLRKRLAAIGTKVTIRNLRNTGYWLAE